MTTIWKLTRKQKVEGKRKWSPLSIRYIKATFQNCNGNFRLRKLLLKGKTYAVLLQKLKKLK